MDGGHNQALTWVWDGEDIVGSRNWDAPKLLHSLTSPALEQQKRGILRFLHALFHVLGGRQHASPLSGEQLLVAAHLLHVLLAPDYHRTLERGQSLCREVLVPPLSMSRHRFVDFTMFELHIV